MRDRLIEQDDASTPLTNDERQGLIPSYITLRRELNEAEQMGILAAQQWAFARKRMVLDEKFLRDLHRHMFSKVWKWAGMFRNSPRNIGVDHWMIPMELRSLLDDARYWVEHAPTRPMRPPRDFTTGWFGFTHSRTVMAGMPGWLRIYWRFSLAGSPLVGGAPIWPPSAMCDAATLRHCAPPTSIRWKHCSRLSAEEASAAYARRSQRRPGKR
ncbi:MAG TPA: hypothetical protein VGG97_08245 [Bryobacteraceae bacterium]|jgi:hypothetical protein